jgi:hypothetical protein
MHHGYRLLLLAALFSLSYSNARATIMLQLSADVDGEHCEIADPGAGGLVTVYVLVKYSDGATGIRFSAPLPPNSGLTHVGDNSLFPLIGDSQTDIAAGLGTCQSGTIEIMTMLFISTSAGEPCTLYTIQSGATYTDCSFAELPLKWTDGVALNSNGQCNPVPIRNPSPADGAVGVPLITVLSWDDAYYVCATPLASAGTGVVYFGTTPNPPYSEAATNNHEVGPLAPGVKYYWRIYGDYPYVSSPVWSFTTTTSVAVQASTWGAIKALYR